MKILALIGSLRAASFSRKLALAAAELAPEGTTLEIVDGRDLPLYDQDLDGEEKPAPVQTLLDALRIDERLESMEAFQKHFATPHMAKFNEAISARPPRSMDLQIHELGDAFSLPS